MKTNKNCNCRNVYLIMYVRYTSLGDESFAIHDQQEGIRPFILILLKEGLLTKSAKHFYRVFTALNSLLYQQLRYPRLLFTHCQIVYLTIIIRQMP